MIDRKTIESWRASAPNFVRRQIKTAGQARYGWSRPRQVSFVFGCQRSGTKMVMRILENSPLTRIYHENHGSAFVDFQLRPDWVIRSLIAVTPAPCQVFKPICDSQEADLLLERFPDARGLWTFRHYDDVANSAAVKWGEHQRDVVNAVAQGDTARWGWRTRRIPDAAVAEVRRVWRPDLNPSEGCLLFWYLRNQFYFSLGLDTHPRMRLVRYEDLVRTPLDAFPDVFEQVGAPFSPEYVARVRTDSIKLRAPPPAHPDIRALCEGLQARLCAALPAPRPPPLPRAVLLVINTLGTGGAERYVVTVANWLAERGVEVSVAASHGELAASLRPDVVYRDLPLTRVRGELPAAAGQLRAFVRERRPDVIVANSLAVTWVSRLAAPALPVVDVAHGWPDAEYARVAPLLRGADRVVAVSPEVGEKLVAGGLPASKVEVVLNGVDCAPFGPLTGEARARVRAALGAAEGELIVITAGRLTAQKAQHHVIAIARALPSLRFAIVGAGQRAAELSELARAEGVSDRVRLLGLRDDVPALFGASDLYLCTSDWEGMSLTIIEAMASGLPVVSTRTEGAAHLVTDDTGVLVPIGDVPALTAAVEALAGDPERRARLGAAGAARARAHFSHDRMARELSNILVRTARGA